MNNFPPGTEVHDTDPPPQEPLAGRVVAEVIINMSCIIERRDQCWTQNEAAGFMDNLLRAAMQRIPRCFVIGEITFRVIEFEPD